MPGTFTAAPGCSSFRAVNRKGGIHAAGIGASPRGAGRRTRTPDLLITNQLLYQLSYTGVFSFSRSPPGGGNHHLLHTGLEPQLRRNRSSIHRLADNRIPITGGISRNFSALRLCIGRIRSSLCKPAPAASYHLLSTAVMHHLQQKLVSVCIISTGREPFARWNRPDSNRRHNFL